MRPSAVLATFSTRARSLDRGAFDSMELFRELRHHVEATGFRGEVESTRESGVYVVATWAKRWSNSLRIFGVSRCVSMWRRGHPLKRACGGKDEGCALLAR